MASGPATPANRGGALRSRPLPPGEEGRVWVSTPALMRGYLGRDDLTACSTWLAAGGFRAMTADTRVSAPQKGTIGLYPQVEEESSQSAGLHMSGGMELAETPERGKA